MTTRGNVVGRDAGGRAVLTSSAGQQVMMEWEREYMEQCVDALGIRAGVDRVLEIGFGLAYSAARIQLCAPRRHTVIECDESVLERADAFAAAHPSVEVVRGTWQAQLPALGEFDCVFFDDFPLPELQPPLLRRARSRWHEFLDVALKHAAPGARISGYLARPLDLARAGCVVQVREVDVQVPANCDYFPYETALVPVITVVDPAAAMAQIDARKPVPARRSRRFVQAFEKARAAQENNAEDAWIYGDDSDAELSAAAVAAAGNAARGGQRRDPTDRPTDHLEDRPRYLDADSRRAFLRSLQQAKARQIARRLESARDDLARAS